MVIPNRWEQPFIAHSRSLWVRSNRVARQVDVIFAVEEMKKTIFENSKNVASTIETVNATRLTDQVCKDVVAKSLTKLKHVLSDHLK